MNFNLNAILIYRLQTEILSIISGSLIVAILKPLFLKILNTRVKKISLQKDNFNNKHIYFKIIKNNGTKLLSFLVYLSTTLILREFGFFPKIMPLAITWLMLSIVLSSLYIYAKQKIDLTAIVLTYIIIISGNQGSDILYSTKNITFNIITINITLYSIIRSAMLIYLLFSFLNLILSIAEIMVKRHSESNDERKHEQELKFNLFKYLIYTIFSIALLTVFGISSTQIALVGGALGFAVGFSLRKLFTSIISGLVILSEKKIKIGDLIETNIGQLANVKSIGVRSTTLRTFDGKDLIVPNDDIVNFQTINYTYDEDKNVRLSNSFYIVNKNDINQAMQILRMSCLKETSINATRPIITCVRDVSHLGIHIMVLFWIKDVQTAEILRIKSKIFASAMKDFEEKGITLYYEKTLNLWKNAMHDLSDPDDHINQPYINAIESRTVSPLERPFPENPHEKLKTFAGNAKDSNSNTSHSSKSAKKSEGNDELI